MSGITDMGLSASELDEAVGLLQDLIRIDTTNPPGNEGKCAEYLKATFERNGIECEVVGEPGRENAIARIRGAKEKPRLLFLSHTDVVPATNVGTWKHPPFSGEIEDQWIYGRGACDDKFDAAAQAMALILTKRKNVNFNGTLLYVSVADEEVNGTGAEWVTNNMPSKVASEFVIGEGGGPPARIGPKTVYKISTGEKGLIWLRLTSKGRAGHGSTPTLGDNADIKMAKAFLNLSNLRTKIHIHKDVAAEIKLVTSALFGEKQGSKLCKSFLKAGSVDKLLDKVRLKDEETSEQLRALTRMTISPNVIHGGTETNVIPGECQGQVDIRLIPGQNREFVLRIVEDCIKGLNIKVEPYQYTESSLSPSNTPFYEAIRSTLTELSPECTSLPQLSTGMSDSRFWRKLGSIVYGFVPMSPETRIADVACGVHASNERVNIPSLSYGTTFLCNLTPNVLR